MKKFEICKFGYHRNRYFTRKKCSLHLLQNNILQEGNKMLQFILVYKNIFFYRLNHEEEIQIYLICLKLIELNFKSSQISLLICMKQFFIIEMKNVVMK